MSEPEIQTEPVFQYTGLTQWQRVTSIFSAPSKTFTDIQQGNKSWWLPFVLTIVFTCLFFGVISARIGWEQVAENTLKLNSKAEARLAQAPPDQQATSKKITTYSIEGASAASPILILISTALGSLILMATINFGFGGKAKFESIFTVWFYAGLPGLIKVILGIAVILAGTAPESFNVKNFAPTNVGAFLSPTETNPALYTFLSDIDVISIWTMILLGAGLTRVAGLKNSSGYIAVFGWWILLTVASVATALIGS